MNRSIKRLSSTRRRSPVTGRLVKMYIDGAARGNPGPAGVGVVLIDGSGKRFAEIATYLGQATNNVAESCALIVGLQQLLRMGRRHVMVLTDSELLARQVTGAYRVKDQQLQWLHVLIQNLVQGFTRFDIQHVPRAENRQADRLANRAITEALKNQPVPRRKPIVSQGNPSQPTFLIGTRYLFQNGTWYRAPGTI